MGPVPVFTKALYACLGGLPELVPGTGWRDFKATVALSPAAWAELDFWYTRLPLWNGRAVDPLRVTRVLYTDASGGGWGALLARARGRAYEPAVLRMSSAWDSVDSVSAGRCGDWVPSYVDASARGSPALRGGCARAWPHRRFSGSSAASLPAPACLLRKILSLLSSKRCGAR